MKRAFGRQRKRWENRWENYAEANPEMIWPLVVKHGSSDNAEVRAAIATCVLEHILEYHFEHYFPMVEAHSAEWQPMLCGDVPDVLEVRAKRRAWTLEALGRA